MKEFIMVEFFNSPALVSRYITTHKISKKKILSLVYNGEKYVLFYYTTVRKEEKYNRTQDKATKKWFYNGGNCK